jgi:solute carrier family 39 (zinc transporter), member 1/2/3
MSSPPPPPPSGEDANASSDPLIVGMKLGGAALIFGLALLGGFVPLKMRRWFDGNGNALSYANCASAGILLGASLVHLLFDAEDIEFDYPLAHLLAGVGFFLAFILEKILFVHQHDHGGGGGGHGHGHGHGGHASGGHSGGHGGGTHSGSDSHSDVALEDVPLESSSGSDIDVSDMRRNLGGRRRHSRHSGSSSGEDRHAAHGAHGHGHGSHDETNDSEGDTASGSLDGIIVPSPGGKIATHSDDEGDGLPEEGKMSRSAVWLFFAVVSLESAISGSAMGVATKFLGAFVIFIAIVTHIWAEAFALMSSVLKANFTDKEAMRILLMFSGMTPLGTGIGMLLQVAVRDQYATKVISATLMAFAAGTFLYVAICELIAEEFENLENKWTKLNFMLFGFAFMTVLAAWVSFLSGCSPSLPPLFVLSALRHI